MARSIEIKEQVLAYRQRGYSIKELARMFGVSKATVSVWTRDVELVPAARTRLIFRTRQGPIIAAERKKASTDAVNKVLFTNAKLEAKALSLDKNSGRILCALIYWCEGAKSHNRVQFTNSDPELVNFFIDLLEHHFDVPRFKLVALLHLHEYHAPAHQQIFWATKLGLESDQFRKPYIKPHTGKRIRPNYPGCINITCYDTMLAKNLLFLAKAFLGKK